MKEVIEINLKQLVREAAEKNGITGVMKLVEHCKMDYRKVIRVWNGDKNAKLSNVEEVLNSLGYQLKAVSKDD
jgi:hypothetical protein